MNEVLFYPQDNLYIPTDLAVSPWHPSLLHGGSPAGLLSYGLEQMHPGEGFQLARVNFDLIRPVPKAPLAMESSVIRDGGRLKLFQIELKAGGKVVAIAQGLYIRQVTIQLPEYAALPEKLQPLPDTLENINFDIVFASKGIAIPPGLHTIVDLRPIKPMREQGSGQAWMAISVPIIEGVENTPAMRVGLLSDFGNGIGQLNLGNNVGMINADICLHLHRLPTTEWIGFDSVTYAEPNGIGMVKTRLYDEESAIGEITQSVMTMAEFEG